MAKAFLITHTETDLDKQGRIHGNLDPPLSASGRMRAARIARSLKSKGIKRILSSPRRRAQELAKLLGEETGATVTTHAELEPWDLGSISGAKANSIKPLLDFFSTRPNRPIPDGEPKAAVLTRYTKLSKTLKPGDAIVAHTQHSLAWNYVRNGGDASKVPMIGGKAGEVKEINL